MCTVVFLPDASGGYLLAHNRDERRRRSRGLPPRRRVHAGLAVLAPRDPAGGGSWIAANAAGLTLCILNAAERDPGRLPARPRSRGLILWEQRTARSITELRARFHPAARDLSGVRAFHLLAVEPGNSRNPARLARLRWDGIRAVWNEVERPALFVSSGVDPRGAARDRGVAWRRLLRENPRVGCERLAAWMASHEPRRGATSVCMHRPAVGTVSRTLVSVGAERVAMHYTAGAPCRASGVPPVRREIARSMPKKN